MASNRPADPPDDLLARLGSLTAEARTRAEAHRTQVELALALQRGMLPGELPAAPGLSVAARYAPAFAGLNVGGDWYDGFVLPDGSIGYSIGDVQGHTIEAAAFMGQVRVGLRALASVTSDPGELLGRTNDLLLSLGGSLFATCTMVRFDPVAWELDSARAGHVPLVRATADGASGVVEDEGGLPLGIESGVTYPVTRYRLTGRGAFVLVTDGVVEGPSLAVDEGLAQVATLAGVGVGAALGAESLATSVMRIADSIGHDDDAAVLVISHDAPPQGAAPGGGEGEGRI
ncbi:PP2C family protein-serine/threonine phosphatase [Streptomyces sp. NPDC059578]|uniref:PP2C family protein-serine/threonine phosphatase n=1 Tax=unclassified Streptomyces TaxID=2593676 RepID=UPI00366982B4